MDSNFYKELANKVNINGPAYLGAKMPANGHLCINEANIPKDMWCKSIDIEPSKNGLSIDYETLGDFDDENFHKFLEEIHRLTKRIGSRYGLDDFAINVKIESRDGKDCGYGEAVIGYELNKNNTNESIICKPSTYSINSDYEYNDDMPIAIILIVHNDGKIEDFEHFDMNEAVAHYDEIDNFDTNQLKNENIAGYALIVMDAYSTYEITDIDYADKSLETKKLVDESVNKYLYDINNPLYESTNPLKQAANYHNKKKKGLPYNYKPNAGDVVANNKFFNKVNTPNGSVSNNPCGPMAGAMGEGIELNIDKSDVNLRDALNEIDSQLEQPCLLDMYLTVNLSEEEKLELAKMITSDNFDINSIYDFLNSRYLTEDIYDFESINDIEDLKEYIDEYVNDPLLHIHAVTFSTLRNQIDLDKFTNTDIIKAARSAGLRVQPIQAKYSYYGTDDNDYIIYRYSGDLDSFKDAANKNINSSEDAYYLYDFVINSDDSLSSTSGGIINLKNCSDADIIRYVKKEAKMFGCKLVNVEREDEDYTSYWTIFVIGRKKDLRELRNKLLGVCSDEYFNDSFPISSVKLSDKQVERYFGRS